MKYLLKIIAVGGMLLVSTSVQVTAQERDIAKRTANLLVISEAAYATAILLNEKTKKEMKSFSWKSEYTDTTWSLTIDGKTSNQQASVSMTGYLWGEEEGVWSINFSGNGKLTDEPVLVHGRGVFTENKRNDGTSDFDEMRFSHLVKVGANSWWGWIKGTELILGGVIGGAGGVLAAPATGGASLLLGIGGAIGGAAAAASISNEVREFIESDEPVPPPQMPEPPSEPRINEPIVPKESEVLIAVFFKEGNIIGAGPNETIKVYGNFSNNKGTASGGVEIFN